MIDTHTDTQNGADAFDALRIAVQYCWFQPARLLARLDLWRPSLVEAFAAVLADDWCAPIAYPGGVTRNGGATSDTAEDLLNAFDEWLGGNAVWSAIDTVQYR